MSDRVLIPLPGVGTLSLSREAYEAALIPVEQTLPAAAAAGPIKLLSDKEMEEATGIAASWFATQARERRIPFRKLGRYVRFDFDEVMASEPLQRRAIPPGQMNRTGSLDRKGRASV
jgi:hypothetical protein